MSYPDFYKLCAALIATVTIVFSILAYKLKHKPKIEKLKLPYDPYHKTVDEVYRHYDRKYHFQNYTIANKNEYCFPFTCDYDDLHPETKVRKVDRVKITTFLDDYPTGEPKPYSYYYYNLDSFKHMEENCYPKIIIYLDTEEKELREEHYNDYWYNIMLKNAMARKKEKTPHSLIEWLFG